MTTANDIITQAAKKAGILGLGQTLDAADINDGLTDLNDMLAQWAVKRWLVYVLNNFLVVSTGQTTPYTVGPGGQFAIATARPNRIEAAFLRQIGNIGGGLPIDYPLKVIPAREEYNATALKTLLSFPKYAYYSPEMPLGLLHIYPYPTAALYETHITVKNVLQQFADTTKTVSLPPEYIPALKYGLAKRLRQSYGKKADPELNNLARDGLDVLRQANIAVPELTMPQVLVRPSLYNIYSDQTY
jgi:hypothetical protein